ncbi:hypothetical protein [Agrobacterium rosae]|uniref:Uncharacterized protein n=1 Tax=Agrobacterium rosae TaxID=1972867 RepID=A0AAW9FLU0_9HYPH|nr:hypothetical protein [Agrobacterium rosae]MDX8305547.1 hypothetical protein [Agrobacterium rosae]
MTMSINPQSIVWGTFDGLEPPAANWADQVDYWEDYTRRFFRSNGKDYGPQDSNVVRWLTATDRAPFAHMLQALLPALRARADIADVDLVIFAHWLPDIHLGTSVTNLALHSLGLDAGLGFAISDRGRSAPLFAMHCIDRYLTRERNKALLIVMDQKHLLYNSAVVSEIAPLNSASMMVLSRGDDGSLHYRGYHRRPCLMREGVAAETAGLATHFGLDPASCVLVSDGDLIAETGWPGPALPQEPRLLCSAPLVALADHAKEGGDYLLVTYENECLSGVCLSARKGSRP